MKRNYKIRVIATATVLVVGAKSLSEARRLARGEFDNGKTFSSDTELIGIVSKEHLPVARAFADFVSEETAQ